MEIICGRPLKTRKNSIHKQIYQEHIKSIINSEHKVTASNREDFRNIYSDGYGKSKIESRSENFAILKSRIEDNLANFCMNSKDKHKNAFIFDIEIDLQKMVIEYFKSAGLIDTLKVLVGERPVINSMVCMQGQ